MLDYDYSYIGFICQILDDAKVNYHHCDTWFKLFLNDGDYCIETRINSIKEVVVYKGNHISWCHNANAPIVFQGNLQDFADWLEKAAKLRDELNDLTEREF